MLQMTKAESVKFIRHFDKCYIKGICRRGLKIAIGEENLRLAKEFTPCEKVIHLLKIGYNPVVE